MQLKNIDFIGAALSIIGALLIILGLTEGGESWRKAKAYIPLIIGVFTFFSSLCFEVFYIRRFQKKNQERDKLSDWKLRIDLLYPPEIIKIPNFLSILIVTGLYYSTLTMLTSMAVQYYGMVELNSTIVVAVKVLPLSLGLIFGALTYRPSYYNKIGLKNLFILSAALSLGCCVWFSRTDFRAQKSYWKFGMVSLFFYGYAINIFFNIYIGVVVSNTPLHLQGVVNGIYQTCSQVLLSVGSALVPSIIGNIQAANNYNMKLHIHRIMQSVFYVMMGFHAVILIIVVFFVKNPKIKKNQDDSDKENFLQC